MAIERLAICVLSVAFTASLILYPHLPPGMPPQAGRHGPFVGGPFVAFLLPTAAMVLWWIVAALGRRSPTVAPRAVRAGAVAACFLSAFHVMMVTAYVGGQPWLVRALGALVGAFLVVTGNDLPRTRPAMLWSVCREESVGSRRLNLAWHEHRVAGYVRVLMGLAVCVMALLGAPGFQRLIVVAVCVEVVIRVAVGAVEQRRKRAVV